MIGGNQPSACRWPLSPALVRALFTRGIAFVYVVAFLSFWRQAHGLIGSHGILPAAAYLEAVALQLGSLDAVLRLPTLFWSSAGDTALHVLSGVGVLAALGGLAGVAPALCLTVCWVCYLSIVHAGQLFFSYQWDILLLEAGFLAIFWAPLTWRWGLVWPGAPSLVVVWLGRWLLFRLLWSSGVVKLLSGDPTWRNLTATTFHYETQPLPLWISHYAHHLPVWIHHAEVVLVFVIEFLLPFVIFGPRRWRLVAAAGFAALQFLIAVTGNYGFFNLLTLVLCLALLDTGRRHGIGRIPPVRTWPATIVVPLAMLLFVLGATNLAATTGVSLPGTRWLSAIQRFVTPLHLSNRYGLFASMTTARPEIVVEGSADGRTWKTYEFHWKATDPNRRPGFVPLHMPRLDWQLWFAALQGYEGAPWFGHFAARLLEGEPTVTELLAVNPFADTPPRLLRSRLFQYRFSGPAQRAEGVWWTRSDPRPYTPVLSLRSPQKE